MASWIPLEVLCEWKSARMKGGNPETSPGGSPPKDEAHLATELNSSAAAMTTTEAMIDIVSTVLSQLSVLRLAGDESASGMEDMKAALVGLQTQLESELLAITVDQQEQFQYQEQSSFDLVISTKKAVDGEQEEEEEDELVYSPSSPSPIKPFRRDPELSLSLPNDTAQLKEALRSEQDAKAELTLEKFVHIFC